MEVSIYDARNRFSELVEAAERGESIVVTRRGRPVARIAPIDEAEQRAHRAREWLAQADDLRNRIHVRMGRSFTHEELIAARDEGRR